MDVAEHVDELGEAVFGVSLHVVLFELSHLVVEGIHILLSLCFFCGVFFVGIDSFGAVVGPVELGHVGEHERVGLRAFDLHAFVRMLVVEGYAERAAVVDHKVEEFGLFAVEEGIDAGVEFFLAGKGDFVFLGLSRVDGNERVAEMLSDIVFAIGERGRREVDFIVVLSNQRRYRCKSQGA